MQTAPDTHTYDISVIIAAYEAQDFIHGSIEAALKQTDVNLQIIIVDDASPTPLWPIIQSIVESDARIQHIRLDENGGPSKARNAALEIAQGEFVAVLDADDSMKPDRLATMLAHAVANDCAVVVDNMISQIKTGTGIRQQPFLDLGQTVLPMAVTLPLYIDPAKSNHIGRKLGYLKPLIRKSFLDQHQIRYEETLRNSEDYYLIANILLAGGKMDLIDLAGYHYSVREGSISHRLSPQIANAVLQKEKAFQKQYLQHMSPLCRAHSKERLSLLEKQTAFETMAAELKAGKLALSLKTMAAYPWHIPHMISRLIGIAFRKANRTAV